MKKSLLFFCFFILFSTLLKAQNYDTVKTLFINKNYSPQIQQTKQDSQVNNLINPNVFCGGTDKRVLPSTNPQSEVHISIDKTNTNNILVSANTFTTNYNQGYYYTTNGGTSWAGADQLPGSTVLYGDPSTAYDIAGNVFISSMIPNLTAQDADGYYIQKSANKGAAWGALLRASDTRLSFDKEMIAADNHSTSPYKNYVYAAWSDLTPGIPTLKFNRSTNGGTTFSTPITLKNTNGVGQGANVQTGPNGEVYVCWADYTNGQIPAQGIGFVKSTNGGASFTAPTIPINYVGIRTRGGGDPAFNNTRVNDFPSMAVDKSNAHTGRIYIVFAAQENGNGKSVVQITWSDDGGLTWTIPKTISIFNGRQNWFPWIAVDDSNGKIYVDYYSLDQATGFSTNTYVAYSFDGGATFQNQTVSDVPHTTQSINNTIFAPGYAGDYIGMTAYGGKVYATWMDNRSGTWQIYVSQVSDVDISGDNSFCTTSNPYSISNLPANSSVTWSTSPSGRANLSCTNCNQTTLTKVSNGIVTLTGTITQGCGSTTIISKTITIGNPVPNGTSSISSNCSANHFNVLNTSLSAICSANTSIYFSYNIVDSRYSNFVWTPVSVPPGASWSGNGPNLNMSVTTPTSQGQQNSETIALTATGPCGVYNVNFISTAVYVGGFNFTIAPNPSQDNVTVSSNNQTLSKTSSQNLIYAIKITDHFGTLRKSFEYKSGITTIRISLTELNSGIYLISVFDGNKWSSKQLVIQK